MKIEQTTLTKSEFITRSMAGEVFVINGNKYFYDGDMNKESPFRCGKGAVVGTWGVFNGKTIFTVVKPKKAIVLEEWLLFDETDRSHHIVECEKSLLKSYYGSTKIQKLSERTIEVEEKAQS